jgi:UDP-glucose 4-epimerase
MATILVTGGAGYIGSHMALMLAERGHKVAVIDNLSTGFKNAVISGDLVVTDLANQPLLKECFAHYKFDAVMHFAASILTNESIKDPEKYYRNNIVASLSLLEVMRQFNVSRLIFSSTAAIYGEPKEALITIDHPKNPMSPYARSKLMFERMLQDYDRAYGLRSISLRYFNAAGADPDGRLGERHNPETHLIPIVLQTALGKKENIKIYGNDYDTPDGTCVRDYVHVVDLCEAHLLGLEALLAGHPTGAYNLGNGEGYSVLDVINAAREITGKKIETAECPRRADDSSCLVVDASIIKNKLHWQPKHPNLTDIIKHAWQWENKR